MNPMTHLDRDFLWFQFKAGPPLRFLQLPLIPLFYLVFAFAGGWAWLGSLLCTVTVASLLIPEPKAFRAYGMNRSRACQQVLFVLVPVTLLVAGTFVGVASPLSSFVGALLGAVVFLASHLSGGESVSRETIGRLSLPGKLEIFAVLTGAIAGALYGLCTTFGPEWVAAIVPAMPLLVYWAWAAGDGFASAAVAQAYGRTRKRWAGDTTAKVVITQALIAMSGALAALLIDATLPRTPFVLFSVAGVAALLAAKAMELWLPNTSFFPVLIAWMSGREMLNPRTFDPASAVVVYGLSGILLAVAGCIIVPYLFGAVNVKRAQ
ncbi:MULTISPECIES: hypothetical protein [Corynebacterium]|uniref:hypothetical protein n=1 Tax=Corynebacterium TaxID=1716 RepID=UPI0008A24527|nr:MULTISPECIES: hypothetical protein [Corynebacterium]MDK8306678.1 hypothetical protein [Corynebacterium imitans]MDK8638205.1 hypothetical protein [Corynebacterium imitans]MDK8773153.1 hypothetical protein [Corynebacterium imitans]OFP38027.1 hypothetical protein HMPREF2990_02165 [Corynebacterium sp. HMSC071B10]